MPKHTIFLAFYALVLAWWCYGGYLAADAAFYAGCILAPIVLLGGGSKKAISHRWAALALICILAGWNLPSRTLHFLALAFSALHVAENHWGRIDAKIAVAWVLVMSSLIRNFVIVFGFPVRLALSKYAASALTFIGMPAHAEGNLIHFRGEAFVVDPACMGLSMVQISLLFALTVSQIQIRRPADGAVINQKLHFGYLLVFLASVLALNMLFNLLRIILLVLFAWKPDTVMHEIGGLVGLLLYVFIPTWYLGTWLRRKYGTTSTNAPVAATDQPIPSATWRGYISLGVQVFLAGSIAWIAATETRRTLENPRAEYPKLDLRLTHDAYATTQLAHGVMRHMNDSVLIYTKPIPGFYASEHSPLVCWQGGGYQFSASNQAILPDGRAYYIGVLQKPGSSPLYTAWWYSNGQTTTLSQWHWRWLDLTGEAPFFLVNLTSSDQSVLERAVSELR